MSNQDNDQHRIGRIPGVEQQAVLTTTDDRAERESLILRADLSEDEIRKRAGADDYQRGKKFKDHFEKLAIVAMYLGAVAMASVFIIWVCHLLLPINLHWLSDKAIDKLQNIFAGGVLFASFADHFRKRLG